MTSRAAPRPPDPFTVVQTVGLTLPDVEIATRYDGSPVLKLDGYFMAGLATHPSAEPNTLVVRCDLEERPLLLEDAPETYYVTDYYRKSPIVLARLGRLDPGALRDLLAMSWHLTAAKTRQRLPTERLQLSENKVPRAGIEPARPVRATGF